MNFANEEQYRQLLDALLKVAPESTHDAIKDLAGHYRTSVEAAHAAGVSEGKEEGRAEGFASLIDPADASARAAFKKAGYELTLYPPLIRSVVLSGGYRCASNHVRPAK